MSNSGYSNSGDYNSGDYNSGNFNSGCYNSGNRNSGNFNSGYSNSGYFNSGNFNSGDYNSGYYNSGNRNSGNFNSGDYNSGYYNSGNFNSGYYNSGCYNSGFFNTDDPKVRLFNKDTKMTFDDFFRIGLKPPKPRLAWVYASSMTNEEKENNPSHKTTGGYLKDTGKLDWSHLTEEDKQKYRDLPNFDADILFEACGLDLREPKAVKFNHEGNEYEIDLEKAKELGVLK